jgi:hypothetical protein
MPIQNLMAKLKGLDSLLSLGGNQVWVDGSVGDDNGYGTKAGSIKGLKQALALMTSGNNDVAIIKNSGATAALCTTRLDAALDWNKDCAHILGQSPTNLMFSPRARVAPTASTTAFANFLTISGSGNLVSGVELYHGFTAGVAASICLAVSGNYNRFYRCHIAGMGSTDAADAQSSTSRSLKITGDENLFEECIIGLDTIARNAGNASIELAKNATSGLGAARNIFKKCIFPFYATATTPLLLKTALAGAIDRYTIFEDCIFWNMGTSTMAGLCTMAASAGGKVVFIRPSIIGSITGFGTDATTRAQLIVTGPTDGSTVSGIGYAPSA